MADYFGLPTVGQVDAGSTISVNSLPFRAYNRIYNEWFRDENLQVSQAINVGDGPDNISNYALRRRGKRHDYFTSALPWPQKGNTAVSLPLGTSAPVVPGPGTGPFFQTPAGSEKLVINGSGQSNPGFARFAPGSGGTGSADLNWSTAAPGSGLGVNLYADLSSATAATINQIRQAFQIQKLLERDARGGTRYTEIVRAHFGVISPDARLQRPEYLGGGSTRSYTNVLRISRTISPLPFHVRRLTKLQPESF